MNDIVEVKHSSSKAALKHKSHESWYLSLSSDVLMFTVSAASVSGTTWKL